MKSLKRLWSMTAIISILIGMIPLQVFAETMEDTGVVIENVEITNKEGQEITSENPIAEKSAVQVMIEWQLSKAALIEEGSTATLQLPENLSYPNQSGTVSDVGDYEVRNNQLFFTFKQNYVLDDLAQVPDFSSAKFYQGIVSLEAQTTSEDVQEETADFGNGLVKTLYYDKKIDPAADPLDEAIVSRAAGEVRSHEANLNT